MLRVCQVSLVSVPLCFYCHENQGESKCLCCPRHESDGEIPIALILIKVNWQQLAVKYFRMFGCVESPTALSIIDVPFWKKMTVLWQSLYVAFSQHLSRISIPFHVFKLPAYELAVLASCKMIGLRNAKFFPSAISQQRNYYISFWHFKAEDLLLANRM